MHALLGDVAAARRERRFRPNASPGVEPPNRVLPSKSIVSTSDLMKMSDASLSRAAYAGHQGLIVKPREILCTRGGARAHDSYLVTC